MLLHSVAVTASISVKGVAYRAIDIVVCIKARKQYNGMAGRLFDTDEVLDLLGNDDPETFLEPMYPGSDDDLGFSDEERESKLIMTNKVVLQNIIIDQLMKVMMRMEREKGKVVREGTAANGDERKTEEMKIAQETEDGSTRGGQHPS